MAGGGISADQVLRTGFKSLASQLRSTEASTAEAMVIDSEPAALEGQADQDASETAFQETVLSKVCDELIYNSRTEVPLLIHCCRVYCVL